MSSLNLKGFGTKFVGRLTGPDENLTLHVYNDHADSTHIYIHDNKRMDPVFKAIILVGLRLPQTVIDIMNQYGINQISIMRDASDIDISKYIINEMKSISPEPYISFDSIGVDESYRTKRLHAETASAILDHAFDIADELNNNKITSTAVDRFNENIYDEVNRMISESITNDDVDGLNSILFKQSVMGIISKNLQRPHLECEAALGRKVSEKLESIRSHYYLLNPKKTNGPKI